MNFKNLTPVEGDSHIDPVSYNREASLLNFNIDPLWEHLNENFFNNNSFNLGLNSKQNHLPKVDIAETENEFLIYAELPGTDGKDINLTLENETLTLKGEKKIEKEHNQSNFCSQERSYGLFQRSFKVPDTINQNKIDAQFNKGILTVKLPKTPATKKEVKRIPINH